MTEAKKQGGKAGAISGILGSLGISGAAIAVFLFTAGGDIEQVKQDHKKLETVQEKVQQNEIDIAKIMTEQRIMFQQIQQDMAYIRTKVDSQ